jgi:hypothetical protein
MERAGKRMSVFAASFEGEKIDTRSPDVDRRQHKARPGLAELARAGRQSAWLLRTNRCCTQSDERFSKMAEFGLFDWNRQNRIPELK